MLRANGLHVQFLWAGVATVVGLLFSVSGAHGQDDAKSAPAVKLYDTYCVQCHGLHRNGQGINKNFMQVQPLDHSDPKEMGKIPDQEIVKAITSGGLSVSKSVAMPAWGRVLTPDEIKELAEYLHHVCQCGPEQKR